MARLVFARSVPTLQACCASSSRSLSWSSMLGKLASCWSVAFRPRNLRAIPVIETATSAVSIPRKLCGLHVLRGEERQPKDHDGDQHHGHIERGAPSPGIAAFLPVGEFFVALSNAHLLGMRQIPGELI